MMHMVVLWVMTQCSLEATFPGNKLSHLTSGYMVLNPPDNNTNFHCRKT
jgi:hypothetical protein